MDCVDVEVAAKLKINGELNNIQIEEWVDRVVGVDRVEAHSMESCNPYYVSKEIGIYYVYLFFN